MKASWMLFSILSACVCDAHKILVIFPLPGSHVILGQGVVRHLLNAGHQVTFVSSSLNKNPHQNLTDIDVTDKRNIKLGDNVFDIKQVLTTNYNTGQSWNIFLIFHTMTVSMLNHPNMQKLLADQSLEFDLVLAEWMMSDLFCGFSAVFDAPLVWFSTVEPHSSIISLVDEPLSPAYNVEHGSHIPPFTFKERVLELWLTIKTNLFKETVIRALQYWKYREIFASHIEARGKVTPCIEELKYNASLVLGNSHLSIGQATRIPQSYKPVGGFHIPDEVPALPNDIKEIMDNSINGVIFFSLGTNINSKDLPEELVTQILNVFRSVKQTVIWKFEDVLPNTPKNVYIYKWAPQQGILAHPNCVLFITHGGLLSITETIHYGVPIVGIPVFADQFINVNRAVKKGYAKRVDMSYNIGSDLQNAIEDILSNAKYTERVRELSFIYHDRPLKPGAELVHWVEHVINTGGAPHLRSPALHVPWYQKAYLDLALLLAALTFMLTKLIKLLYKVIWKINAKKEKSH